MQTRYVSPPPADPGKWGAVTPSLSFADRRALCDVSVTLDGKPAVIRGALNDFATVSQLPSGASHEWAWSTVARIVSLNGEFRS
jgi:hypothetical protein